MLPLPPPVVLRTLKLGAVARVGSGVIESMHLDVATDLMGSTGRDLVARLSAHVLAQDVGTRTQTAVTPVEWHMPATWWDHCKATSQSRLVRWWARRRPPKMLTVTQNLSLSVQWAEAAGFPHSEIVADPRLGGHVVYASPVNHPTVGKPSPPTYRI